MGPVGASLATMGTEQLLLASVFLRGYAMALGRFAGRRGRWVAAGITVCSAVGFVALSQPWESGVVLVALSSVGMGLFTAGAWVLWKATSQDIWPVVQAPMTQPPATAQVAPGSLLERMRARLPFRLNRRRGWP